VEMGVLDWTDTGIVAYSSPVPLGATPEYLSGEYIIQGANSMLPVLNMEIKVDEEEHEEGESGDNKNKFIVVDLCAAPGGKSTHIGALMSNTGILYANDVCKDRTHALKSNIMRMGINNSIITNFDAKEFSVGKVDRVLLDAPCSGTGVIAKDKSIKTSKSHEEIKRICKEQKQLILHAFDMLKLNGVMVYSTCSILVEENEEVVNFLLDNRQNARICKVDVDIGQNGFSSFRGTNYNGSLIHSRRIYPHVHNMDGFYYCKIRKVN